VPEGHTRVRIWLSHPRWPDKVIVGLGAFGALIISSLAIITLDFVDHSLRAPSIFNKTVSIPLVAVINKIDLRTKTLADYFNFNQDGRAEQARGDT